MNFKFCLLLISTLQFHNMWGQSNCKVDPNKIEEKRVQRFLDKRGLYSGDDFNSMNNYCYQDSSNSFSFHEKAYSLKYNIKDVWDAYTKGDIKEIWAGKVLKFGGSYSAQQDSFIYDNSSASYGIEEEQIIVTRLKFVKGILKIVVAHKIVVIDEDNKTLEFCYMEGGVTIGSQILNFSEGENNTTNIKHETNYKSKSKFRDKKLYPKLHTQAIDELHENIKSALATKFL